jgi:pimeloyl-ACP methyl ester carboxylesterase
MKTFDRIILFDMLGYGLSDKPETEYSFSLLEQADTAFEVWKHFNITGGHILAHDMGVSVTTEIIARHENKLLPSWFTNGIKSVTFTNGSMVLSLSKLRISQKLLNSDYGEFFNKYSTFKMFKHQIKSAHGNNNISDEEIDILYAFNELQDGNKKMHLTIKYLRDRTKFEKTRWLPALAKTKLPIHLCWGDADKVARIRMATYLKENVCKDATFTTMKGLGHFGQIGSPEKWVAYVSAYYKK